MIFRSLCAIFHITCVTLTILIIITNTQKKGKIFIIYYSAYGHVLNLANEICKGIESQGSFDVELYTVADAYVDAKSAPHNMDAKRIFSKDDDRKAFINKYKDTKGVRTEGHILVSDLANADAFLFGIPTRFGMAAGKLKTLMDSTGGLWMSGEGLYGKPAGIFFSTGTLGGGQETTALTWITQLTHHGMIYVPIGYGKIFGKYLTNLKEIHGGSPYGSGTLAGPMGGRQLSDIEKEIAKEQGKYFAGVSKKFL